MNGPKEPVVFQFNGFPSNTGIPASSLIHHSHHPTKPPVFTTHSTVHPTHIGKPHSPPSFNCPRCLWMSLWLAQLSRRVLQRNFLVSIINFTAFIIFENVKSRQTKKAANNLWHLWHIISFLSFKDYF